MSGDGRNYIALVNFIIDSKFRNYLVSYRAVVLALIVLVKMQLDEIFRCQRLTSHGVGFMFLNKWNDVPELKE